MLIRDLIELPPIKTVIQLRDAEDARERKRLVEYFVLTEEVRFGLQVIFDRMLRREGCGFFLKGHFGSGKSHFLAYLSIVLEEGKFEPAQDAKDKDNFLVLRISLVEYAGAISLETIVRQGLEEKLAALPPSRASHRLAPTGDNRKNFFEAVFQRLHEQGYAGLALLIDELSEFLRSKPSAPEFNEDIRFLQFLGEASGAYPFWIVAALQEHLEETGEIHQDTFHKIKDRYPVRLALTAQHAKSLIGELLIRKKPEAAAPIRDLYRRLKAAFPQLSVSGDEFYALYPVHPATVDLLEDLKPLFSKTRGFVDFIHYELRGDTSRGISGMLDEPHETLLCPDRIFDHFLDRMKSTIEVVPYIDTVFAYFRKELPRIASEPADQRYALRLLKLLILQEISPVKRTFSLRELSEMLLERLTDLDPEANYQYTAELADRLGKEGEFVVASGAGSERTYHLQFEINVSAVIQRKLEYRRTLLHVLGGQVAARLFPYVARRSDFFQNVRLGEPETLVVEWQNTRRNFTALVAAGESASAREKAREARPELWVLLPGQSTNAGEGATLVPALPEERQQCLEALALFDLLEEYHQDESAQGRRIRERLEQLIDDRLPLLTSIFRRSYSQSRLTFAGQETELRPSAGSFRQLLEEAGRRILDLRFPKHYLIAPQQSYYPSSAVDELIEYFQSMSPECFEKLRWGRTLLEGFLLPTGLVKRHRKDYVFASGAGQSGPLELLLSHLQSGACGAEEAFERLASSEYGMSEAQFKPFLLAALFAGFLTPHRGGRRVPLAQLDAARLMDLALAPGETVTPEATEVLRRLEFVPPNLRKPSLSYAECQQCWDAVKSLAEELQLQRDELEGLMERFREYRLYQRLGRTGVEQTLEAVERLLASVKVSYGPIEGLERFARAVTELQAVNEAPAALGRLHVFFADRFTSFLFMANYLERARPVIPGGSRYNALREPLESLLSKIEGWDPAGAASDFEQLRAEFEAWLYLYASAYRDEHQAYHQSAGFAGLEDLSQSPELKLLRRLEPFEALVFEFPSAEIRAQIQEALSHRCSRGVWEELQQRPVCACGFELGKISEGAGAEGFRRKVELQLQQAVAQLQHPRFRELLDRLDFHLKKQADAGAPERAVAAAALLHTLRKLKSVRQVAALQEMAEELTPEFIRRVNEFEPGSKPFQVRYLSQFYSRAGSEPQTRREWVRRFDHWLSEGLADPEQPIRLVEAPRAQSDEDREWLRSLVETSAPELGEAAGRLSPEELLYRLFGADLVARYRLDLEKSRPYLPLLPQEKELVAYARLAEALRESERVREPREAFESQVGEAGYEALGLLKNSHLELVRLICRETLFVRLVRLATERLLKKLTHSPARAAAETREILKNEWSSAQEKAPYGELLETALWLISADPAKHAGLIPYMTDKLRVYSEQLNLPLNLKPPSEDGARSALSTSREALAEVLKRSVSALRSKFEVQQTRLIFVDCISWPLWQLVSARLRPRLPSRIRLVAEEQACAHLPTTTLEQVTRWLEAGGPQLGRRVQKGFSFPEGAAEDGTAYKVDWVDEKIHTSRESVYFLYEEIAGQLVPQLLSFLNALPARSLLVLFSDHGFTENPTFNPKDKYRHPRYRHGGDSPWETIVPVVFFYAAN